MIKININDIVKVKLTEHAIKILRMYHDRATARYPRGARPFVPPKTDEDGYTKYQLHNLMHTFGQEVWSSKLIFEDNEILVEVKDED